VSSPGLSSDSEAIVEYYRHQHVFGLDRYFVMIEDYINTDFADPHDNKPLLITGDDGTGKKNLLVNWMEYHKARQHTVVVVEEQMFPDVIMVHFASAGGTNTNYFYTIYKMLVKLRDIFKIGFKVEMMEEKIRNSFPFWLQLLENSIR
jgi:hypothetical protein